MDSTGESTSSEAKSNDTMNFFASATLPTGFAQDPAGFLTLIASRPASADRLSSLAGPLAKWFRDGEAALPGFHPATQIAHLYLCAAAKQLIQVPISASEIAAVAPGVVPENPEWTYAKHRDETLEGITSAAALCPDRSSIAASGILNVLANLVVSQSASNSTMASPIAASLSNLPSSSSTAFPPLIPAHTAFVQCAVMTQEYGAAETVIRGTWPVPTTALKKQKKRDKDESYVAVSIILRYYYLRGIIHYECGQYALAHRCWWTCLSIPVETENKTAIDAWKKLTLVQPFLDIDREVSGPNKIDVVDANNDGDSSDIFKVKKAVKSFPETRLPKCMPKGLSKSIHAFAEGRDTKQQGSKAELPSALLYSVYLQLGPAVEAVDRSTVERLLRTHESVLVGDGNMGMANNCLRRVKDLQVKKASTMFSVTSIPILARRWKVTPEEASQQLSDAIESGVVPCRLEADGGVVFSSAEQSVPSTLTDLNAWMALLEKMQHLDVDMTVSSKHSKVKDDKPSGPRGVEEFYGAPAI